MTVAFSDHSKSFPFNWTVTVWGVYFKEKVLKLFENPFFSILVNCITIVLGEQEVEFQWRRGSAVLFFHNDFLQSRKRGLKLTFLILSTAFLDANEELHAKRTEARTTTQVSKSKNDKQKRKTFPLIPGENTKYASCMLLQKGNPPQRALNQKCFKGCFVTPFARTRTHKAFSEQSRGSTELRKNN